MKTEKKHRFIKFNEDIYIVVGQGKTGATFPGEYFEAVNLKDHDLKYNRAQISIITERILISDCEEITDKKTLRLIRLLYG